MTASIEDGTVFPAVYKKGNGNLSDFHVLRIPEYDGIYESMEFESVSRTIEFFYSHRDTSNRIAQKSREISKAVRNSLKKMHLKEQRLNEDLHEALQGDRYRLYGELITANIHNIAQGLEEVTLTNYYNGEAVTIPLDDTLSASDNAQRYFKKYTKAKRAVEEKESQIKIVKKDTDYLESVMDAIERADSMKALDDIKTELIDTGFIRQRRRSSQNKKNGTPVPYTYKSHCGLDIIAGRNNRENDYITFRAAGKNDLWFHTKDIPGSHVILFTKNSEADDKSIYEAACIAAFHSKGRNSENVPVDYTKVRYVKKPNGAKPGMVIFTDNKTLYVTPKLPGK